MHFRYLLFTPIIHPSPKLDAKINDKPNANELLTEITPLIKAGDVTQIEQVLSKFNKPYLYREAIGIALKIAAALGEFKMVNFLIDHYENLKSKPYLYRDV